MDDGYASGSTGEPPTEVNVTCVEEKRGGVFQTMDAQTSGTDYAHFDDERAQIAENLALLKDKSTKGSIDEPMGRFLELINAQRDWITTSTCSGRLVSYVPGVSSAADWAGSSEQQTERTGRRTVNGKGGGSWLFVTHYPLEGRQLGSAVETLMGARHRDVVSGGATLEGWDPAEREVQEVHLVYQPPVLHLLARSVAVARPLLAAAIAAGFRNSGLTVGLRGRVVLAIRAAPGGLDVPIAAIKPPSTAEPSDSPPIHLLLPRDYLAKLLHKGHHLMLLNFAKLDRLFIALHHAFQPPNINPHPWESPAHRRLRLRAEGLARQAASPTPTVPTPPPHDDDDDFPQLSLLHLD